MRDEDEKSDLLHGLATMLELEDIREKSGLSLEQISENSGLPMETVYSIECGSHDYTMTEFLCYLQALGYTIAFVPC